MPTKGIARRLFANWPAKVLSLAAALLLFFFYRLNRLEDRYLSVPLTVTTNDEYVPTNQVPRSVRLTLRGESNSLFSIQEGDLRASLDLSSIKGEGSFRVSVLVEKFGSALGIDPLEISSDPAEISVSLERRTTRIVPVTPSFRGFLEPGYELVSFEISPPEVEIYGPASAVARASDVQTDFIDLTGRSANFEGRIKLVRKEGLVGVSGVESVAFSAIVQRSLAIKTYSGLPIAAFGLVPALALAAPLPPGNVLLRSQNLEASAFEPAVGLLSVDCSRIAEPGSYELEVLALVPEGFTVERYEPQRVTVLVAAALDKGGGSSPDKAGSAAGAVSSGAAVSPPAAAGGAAGAAGALTPSAAPAAAGGAAGAQKGGR